MSNGIRLTATVIDTAEARRAAEFYRALLGWTYRDGDQPPPRGADDPNGTDWLVLVDLDSGARLSFQQVAELAPSTWPTTAVPQQLHLDFTVTDTDALERAKAQVLELGGRELLDRSDDEDEPLYVFADLDGHPFCIFVS